MKCFENRDLATHWSSQGWGQKSNMKFRHINHTMDNKTQIDNDIKFWKRSMKNCMSNSIYKSLKKKFILIYKTIPKKGCISNQMPHFIIYRQKSTPHMKPMEGKLFWKISSKLTGKCRSRVLKKNNTSEKKFCPLKTPYITG